MTDQEIRIAIAESLGIEVLKSTAANGRMGRKKGWGDGDWKMLPHYPKDLNAMHEAEKSLPPKNAPKYNEIIRQVVCEADGLPYEMAGWTFHATAPQRAEAFLRTIGKWKD